MPPKGAMGYRLSRSLDLPYAVCRAGTRFAAAGQVLLGADGDGLPVAAGLVDVGHVDERALDVLVGLPAEGDVDGVALQDGDGGAGICSGRAAEVELGGLLAGPGAEDDFVGFLVEHPACQEGEPYLLSLAGEFGGSCC